MTTGGAGYAKGRDPGAPDAAPLITVTGERVALGPVRREMVPLLARWANDWRTTRTYYTRTMPWTRERRERWYARISGAEPDPVPFVIHAIYERASLRPIGYTLLDEIDARHRTAAFSIMIGEPETRGKGYGTEATRLTLDYAFAARGLHNVMLTVFAFNHAATRAYEKAGFRVFARRTRAIRVAGAWHDLIYMECLASDFVGPVAQTVLAPDAPQCM